MEQYQNNQYEQYGQYDQYNQQGEFNQLQYQKDAGLLHTSDERQIGLFLHLSPLASMVVPLAGTIIPVVLWLTKKDEMPAIDVHGKEVINWLITSFLASIAAIILMVVGFIFAAAIDAPPLAILSVAIGVIALLGLTVANIFYAVYGGVKANSGEHWEYPFNISFFK